MSGQGFLGHPVVSGSFLSVWFWPGCSSWAVFFLLMAGLARACHSGGALPTARQGLLGHTAAAVHFLRAVRAGLVALWQWAASQVWAGACTMVAVHFLWSGQGFLGHTTAAGCFLWVGSPGQGTLQLASHRQWGQSAVDGRWLLARSVQGGSRVVH